MAWVDQIKHIVVLALENQSFDRMLGYLKLDDPKEKLEGLKGTEAVPLSPPGDMTPVPVRMVSSPAAWATDPGPGHEFEDVTMQLYGRADPTDFTTPLNNGFALSYSRQVGHDHRRIGERGREIMECLDSRLVPVISRLAKNFVICDHWHASVPGPTWPNRFFLHAATSGGLVDSPKTSHMMAAEFLGPRYRMRTIYENLMEHGHTWKIFFADQPQSFALRNLHRYATLFQRFERFADDVAAGTLPDYVFIEPQYFSTTGNPASDQHPPHDIREGERLIASVYDTLRSNDDVWQHTLFILLYDEHGGFYDHVPPPIAVPPDHASTSASKFQFNRLGLRVPAILISPWVGRGKVDHRLYDHTSLLATVKKLFNLPDFLTERDRVAKTFEGNFLDTPRATKDTPANLSDLISRTPAPRVSPDEQGLSGYQQSLHALAEAMQLPQSEHAAAAQVDAHVKRFLGEEQSA